MMLTLTNHTLDHKRVILQSRCGAGIVFRIDEFEETLHHLYGFIDLHRFEDCAGRSVEKILHELFPHKTSVIEAFLQSMATGALCLIARGS